MDTQQFETFILERVKVGRLAEAKKLLIEAFAKLADDTLDLETWTLALIPLIEDTAWPEVRQVIENFKLSM